MASTLVGMVVNYLGLSPIRALVLSSILCALISPPLLLLIVMLSNRRSVMGRHTNGVWSNVFGWTAFVLMTAATVAYLVTLFI